jgi:hypothetical protein
MGSTRVNFRLPEALIETADVAAEVTRRNRTGILTEALQTCPEDVEDDETFGDAVVELCLDGRIGFDVLAAFVGRQDAGSIQASKTVLDRGEDLILLFMLASRSRLMDPGQMIQMVRSRPMTGRSAMDPPDLVKLPVTHMRAQVVTLLHLRSVMMEGKQIKII